MFSALFRAVRSPPAGFRTTHRIFKCGWDARTLQWHRWASTTPAARKERLLLTLNPERYTSFGQEVLDISDEAEVVLYNKGREPVRLSCNASTGERFPANTVGLFYGYAAAKSELCSIRFRLCSSVDDFHQGSDLLQSDGRVWSLAQQNMKRACRRYLPLLTLVKSDYPEDSSWLSQRYSVLSLSPQHIVNEGGSAVLDISKKSGIVSKFKTGIADLVYCCHNRNVEPFPADTRGMFYYKQSATAPTAIGELRFRLCNDISLFHAGNDLCSPSGMPWYLSSDKILSGTIYAAVREQLLEEGLLSPITNSFVYEGSAPVMRGPGHPFVVEIGSASMKCVFDTGIDRIPIHMKYLFSATQPRGSLYTGRAVVQFETYPSEWITEHMTRTPLFTLRFLEFLTPVTKTAPEDHALVQRPEPGQYLMRRTRSGLYQPWGYTPNNARAEAVLSEWIKQPPSREWESLKVDSRSHFDAP